MYSSDIYNIYCNIKYKKWNYTKTVGCKIVGSIPTNDIAELESFFDNGFTIWHDESYMFKYEEINDIL